MRYIHIRSLPFEDAFNAKLAVEDICFDVAMSLNLELSQVSVTWQYLHSFHYAHAGQTHEFQGFHAPPVLVEILAMEEDPPDRVEAMLRCTARSVAAQARIDIRNIFIQYRQAQPGQVFFRGRILSGAGVSAPESWFR